MILSSVILEMYGPIPVPRPEQKIAAIGYPTGIPYVMGILGKSFKGVELAFWKQKELEDAHDEGYDGIVNALARISLDEFQKQSAGGN